MPSGIKPAWDDNNSWQQALLLGYEHIRQYEEAEEASAMMGAKLPL